VKKNLENGFITSIRIEKSIKELCSALGIPLVDVFSAGAEILIDYHLKRGKHGKATTDMIKGYFEYKARHIDEIREIVRSYDAQQRKLDLVEKAIEEDQKPKEKIRIWDPDEGYVNITKVEAARRGLV
jgi:hypothetical protein